MFHSSLSSEVNLALQGHLLPKSCLCIHSQSTFLNRNLLFKSKYSPIGPEQIYWCINLGGGHHTSLDIKIICTPELCVPKKHSFFWPLIRESKVSFHPRLSMNPADRDDKWVLWLPPTSRPEYPLFRMLWMATASSMHLTVSQQMSSQGCCKNSLSNSGLVLSQEKELPITDFTLKISDYLSNLISFQNIAFIMRVSFSVLHTLSVQSVQKPVLIPCMSLCVRRQQGLCVKVRSQQVCCIQPSWGMLYCRKLVVHCSSLLVQYG